MKKLRNTKESFYKKYLGYELNYELKKGKQMKEIIKIDLR